MKTTAGTGKKGWLVLELLLSASVAVLVTGLGVMAFFSLLDVQKGLWMNNQRFQSDFARLILRLEEDAHKSDFVIAMWGAQPLEDSAKWESKDHGAHYYYGDTEGWDLRLGRPIDPDRFIEAWSDPNTSEDAIPQPNPNYSENIGSSNSAGNSGGDSEDATHALVFLKGSNEIQSIVYLTYEEDNGDLVYTVERKANNGNRLITEDFITFTAKGFQFADTVAENDQQDASDGSMHWIEFSQDAADTTGGRVEAAFPSPLNRSLRDLKDGKQARAIKNLRNWVYYFAPEGYNRWIKD